MGMDISQLQHRVNKPLIAGQQQELNDQQPVSIQSNAWLHNGRRTTALLPRFYVVRTA
jgi:hypothetical protein